MAPVYGEFKEKRRRRRPAVQFPRIRRNRRTVVCISAIFVLGLYHLIRTFTRDLKEPSISHFDEFAPYQYKPVPGAEDDRDSRPKIRFPHLYSTLSTSGFRSWDRNVVFIAADIKAAGRLAVTACEMSKYDHVQVHFALLGDSSTRADDFQRFVGIGPGSECKLAFHDATAMHTLTLPLLTEATKSAMRHIYRFLRPQVVFIDVNNEIDIISNALKDAAQRLGVPIVELPQKTDNLHWMASLSSQSLRAWNIPKLEIFIRCDKHHGNLERLLKSLQNADYYGILPSRVTIEVGSTAPLHPFTAEFIEKFNWPSRDRISIRYLLSPPALNPASQAIHVAQSFYPVDKDTNILFLDPNIELSPYYFHWLHYVTLEYQYSGPPFKAALDLYGVSLVPPKAFINGTEPFDPHLIEPTSFLCAMPSTEAALFFPQSWEKFFTYLQWRFEDITVQQESDITAITHVGVGNLETQMPPTAENIPTPSNPETLMPSGLIKGNEEDYSLGLSSVEKQGSIRQTKSKPVPSQQRNFTLPNISISPTFSSSWLLHFIEFAKIQGSLMLYPNFGSSPDSGSLAVYHSESPSEANYKIGQKNPGQGEQRLLNSMILLDSLPGWNLIPWLAQPIRDLAGEASNKTMLIAEAREYKMQVSEGCPEDQMSSLLRVADLFCQ